MSNKPMRFPYSRFIVWLCVLCALAAALTFREELFTAVSAVWLFLQHWQNTQMRSLTTLFMRHAQENGGSAILLFTAWLYGVLHAAGPGHGKAVIAAWTITQREKILPAVLTAFGGAALQAVSALFWAYATIGIAGWLMRDSLHQAAWLQQLSNIIVITAGVYLFFRRPNSGCGCSHHHAGHHHQPEPPKNKNRLRFAMMLAIGMRPCSGALLILAVAASRGLWLTGILMTAAMAIGTALTTGFTAFLAAAGRISAADRFISPACRRRFSQAGGLILIMLGIFLFTASLRSPPVSPLR